jgi:hypothetical protein
MGVSAEGVKGGVMMRRENLVVCALMRDAQSWARERGFIELSLAVLVSGSLLVGAGVDWSFVRRAERLATADFNAARSSSAVFVEPGIFVLGEYFAAYLH